MDSTTPAPSSAPTSDLDLECDETAPWSARQFVAAVLAHEDRSRLAPAALPVVSELVTNAVNHTGCDWLMVRVATLPDRVRVSVFDSDPDRLPRLDSRSAVLDGGMGLRIVDHMAAKWGYSVHERSKEVWCDLSE
jgi:anti-sigma regulatory factor (Ser/Thr protein kinase)